MGWEWWLGKASAGYSLKEDVEAFITSCFGYWGKNSPGGRKRHRRPFFKFFIAVKDLAKFSIGTGINLRNLY